MAIMNGTNLAVYNGTTKLAHSQDCSLEVSNDMIDITTKDSAGWKDILPGVRSASLSCNSLYEDSSSQGVDEIYTAIDGRSALSLKFSTETVGEERWTGSFYCTSLSLNAGTEDAASYSASFELNGALTKETVS